MKALVFDHPGELHEAIKLKEIEEPIVGSTQVLVKVYARPVNPSDYLFAKGVYRKKPIYPQIAGLEGSGLIVACGQNVTEFAVGDHVAFRTMNTWAEYCLVDHENLVEIEWPLPFEISSQVGLNAITAIALLEESKVKSGEFLLLNAASSSVGGLIIQMAVRRGIHVVGLVNDRRYKNELLPLGAKAVFSQEEEALESKLHTLTNGQGIHGFLDAVGGKVVSRVIPCMAPYGTIVVYGNLSNNEKAFFSNAAVVYKNLTVKGFGIDHWMSLQSKEVIRSFYREIVKSLHDGTLVFRQTKQVRLEEFANNKSLLSTNDKVVLV
jgi:NADPH:quinone reductase-like Zn-dependent oxidoreductase